MKTENILKTRNGIAIIILQLGIGLSGSLFFPYIEPLLFDLGASFTLITFRRTFVALSSLIVAWLWGAVSDLFHSYKAQISFSFGSSISFCVPVLLFQNLAESVLFLLLALAFFSLFRSMVYPVRNAFITLASEEGKGGANTSYIYAFSSIGWGVGSLIFGFLIEGNQLVTAFLLTFVFSVLTLSLFYILFDDKKVPTEEIEIEQKNIFELLMDVDKSLLVFAIAIFILGLSRSIFFTFFKVKLYVAYGRNYGLFGIATTIAGLIGAAATLLYGKMVDRFGGAQVFALGALIYMSFYFILAFSSNPIILTIPWILPIGYLISIPSVSLTAKLSDENERGRAQGIVSGTQRISGLGTVIGGFFADYLGAAENIQQLSWIFLGLTPFPIISILIIFVLIKGRKEIRNKTTE